ncbi:MAG: transcription-repair coupling factor [Deltaproteobacteria bacterium]|nr:transcription-repair coupling factor [Deltaproteobacteria bacterium]
MKDDIPTNPDVTPDVTENSQGGGPPPNGQKDSFAQNQVNGGLKGSSKAFFLANKLRENPKPTLVILPDEKQAEEFRKDISFFSGSTLPVLFYPSTELLPFEATRMHPDIAGERIEFLYNIIKHLDDKKPFIAITSSERLLKKIPTAENILKRTIRLSIGDSYDRSEFLLKLIEMGYNRTTLTEERGEVSVRGSIIDIFPAQNPESGRWPVRCEFFDDELESIRTFDPETQRSLKELAEVTLLPITLADLSNNSRAKEKLLDKADELRLEQELWKPLYESIGELTGDLPWNAYLPLFNEELITIPDLFKDSDALIVINEAKQIEATLTEATTEINSHESDSLFITKDEAYIESDLLLTNLKAFNPIELTSLANPDSPFIKTNLELRQDIVLKKDLSPLRRRIAEWTESGMRVVVTTHNKGQAERTAELLSEFNANVASSEVALEGNAQSVTVSVGSVTKGFRWPELAISIVTEEEIFGERSPHKAPPKKKIENFLNQMRDLKEGDAIVHTLHGIGVYKGLKRMNPAGASNDYLILEYAGADKLYLPVQRMDLVTKYRAVEGVTPTLDKLGGTGWEKKKGKVRRAVQSIAGELIKLYAERKALEGFAFSKECKIYNEFESSFEFEETEDQARAIDEVTSDMEKLKPMDRLVCGDVGYGKTEVAMRAAFKAVLDKKQVALLVPTTVLAQQHFKTFTERFSAFPVTIDYISRFKKKKAQLETIERLKAGAVDIVIGTHRLLQNDIGFKDLGVIVIDEEHRFGVKNKEKLKELKKNVDVLTLTATPIPRTLQMSLTDIRELSIINTPPQDRLSIITRVIRFNDDHIREAISRELKRGGQIFFVHNRVQSIEAMHRHIKAIAESIKPDIKIAVGHGQMKENELERVMLGFTSGEFDILLSTTIIESGLDIPRANTIIINRADRFGLAELYQLRGRVGRSHHRAYAYLVCPEPSRLTKETQKKMEVIEELTELGSGFRVAAYDLEIRGAGELLGRSQSGHITEIGFDAYSKILEEAVREIKGEAKEETIEPELSLRISQFISEDYIPDTGQRLGIYKRLAMAHDINELEEVAEELTDRYGEMPEEVTNLIETSTLRLELRLAKAIELSEKGTSLYLSLSSAAAAKAAENITKLITKKDTPFRATPGGKIIFTLTPNEKITLQARYMLKEVIKEC